MLGWISPRRIGEQLQQQNHLLRQGWIRIGHVLRFERTSLTNSPTNHSFRPAQRLFSSNFSRQINLWKKSCHRHPRTVRPHYAKSLVQPRNPPEQTLEIASCCSCRCRGGGGRRNRRAVWKWNTSGNTVPTCGSNETEKQNQTNR